jgi:Na+/proline symporter
MFFGTIALFGTAEHVYSSGFDYFLISCADVARILLYCTIINKLYTYKESTSVGQIMDKLYNNKSIHIITGICSICLSITFIAIEFKGIYKTIDYLADVDLNSTYLLILFSVILVFFNIKKLINPKTLISTTTLLLILSATFYYLIQYNAKLTIYLLIIAIVVQSSFGGVSALVLKTMLQFSVIILFLPIVLGEISIEKTSPDELNKYLEALNVNNLIQKGYTIIFLTKLLPVLTPVFLQRISFASSSNQAQKAFICASITVLIFYHLISVSSLKILYINPNIKPQECFLYLIRNILTFPGLKGIALCGILSLMLSTIDAFINTATINFIYDVVKIKILPNLNDKYDATLIKISSILIITISLAISYFTNDMLALLIFGFSVWGAAITIPLLAGIYGFKVSCAAFYASCISGATVNIIYYLGYSQIINSLGSIPIFLILNTIVFFTTNTLYYRIKKYDTYAKA